jgi:hypothetical protein
MEPEKSRPVRTFKNIALAALLLPTPALAAPPAGAGLAPGKPAGIRPAQMSHAADTIIIGGAAAVLILGVILAKGSNNFPVPPPETTPVTSSSTGT